MASFMLTLPVSINRHRSYERERPQILPTSPRDAVPPYAPTSPRDAVLPYTPTSPRDAVPPYAPDVSSQSTDTYSTSTDASQASTTSSDLDHWAKRVFVDDMSTTLLTQTGDA
jgi:hypothetical protein